MLTPASPLNEESLGVLNNVESNQTDGSQVTKIKETLPTDSTKLNPSITISNADSVVASTKVVTKTIGANHYTKTYSYNAAGDLISISAWS